jgi:hypothetical protein
MRQTGCAYLQDNVKDGSTHSHRYYVWDVEPLHPLILVPETQFQGLLEEINSHLKLKLRITNPQREEGLVGRFPDHPACLPRYLGRSHGNKTISSQILLERVC